MTHRAKMLELADKIAAFTPSSKGPIVLIARERRMIEDALLLAAQADAPGGLDAATVEACARLIESGSGMADLIDQDDLDQQAKYVRALVSGKKPAAHEIQSSDDVGSPVHQKTTRDPAPLSLQQGLATTTTTGTVGNANAAKVRDGGNVAKPERQPAQGPLPVSPASSETHSDVPQPSLSALAERLLQLSNDEGTAQIHDVALQLAAISALAAPQPSQQREAYPISVNLNAVAKREEKKGNIELAGILRGTAKFLATLSEEKPSGDDMRALVDWAYLHATEGSTWPSSKTADELIAKAKICAPTQNDADAMRAAVPRPECCPNGLKHGACLYPECVSSCPGRIGTAVTSQNNCQGE